MIISVNWLKKYTTIDGTIDELATRIGARLVEIESVIDLSKKYKDVVIVRVVECSPIEDSDHLNVTKIDDGGVVKNATRDDNGFVQVVCGAPNVHADMLAAWLPPESIVPETFATDTPFVLGAKPLRGVMSNGMLASARELDLFDDHTGILEIDKEAKPGDSFAETYELNDYLLDIENKSLTHRPDTFGVVGFAREVAGIQGTAFHTPAWLTNLEMFSSAEAKKVATPTPSPTLVIEDASLSERFSAIVLADVDDSKKSPLMLQTYLARSGVRPINAAVDISNYLMLLTGQPSHTYDYDKLVAVARDGNGSDSKVVGIDGNNSDVTIHVRTAKDGEKLTLLDDKTIELDKSDIVIAAGDTAIGLAGIMGGKSTAVDNTTKKILLEIATFDLYHMRSSQMRHGIFSEAVTRFTKGIPAPLSAPVLTKAVELFTERTGAVVASAVADVYPRFAVGAGGDDSSSQKNAEAETITIDATQINDVLGTKYSANDMVELLQNVEIKTSLSEDGMLTVSVPYWRHDLHIPEDIIEEVGRLTGYDTIEFALPQRNFVAVKPNDFDQLRQLLRMHLVRAGANEVLTYSFIHGDIMKKVGQSTDNAYRITNSISPDLQYYRQSLLPSLLSHVSQNSKAGFDLFALFELNKIHQKLDGLTDESVPVERDSVAYVVAGAKQKGTAYYEAKKTLEYMLASVGFASLRFVALTDEATISAIGVPLDDALIAPFEPKRSAVVYMNLGENANSSAGSLVLLGVIGEFKASVRRSFKLPTYCAGFEINPRALLTDDAKAAQQVHHYQPLSKYPGVERDVCFQVATALSYQQVVAATEAALDDIHYTTSVEPLDIYQANDADVKNITLRIRFVSYNKTLTGDEVSRAMETVINKVVKETNGKVI